MWHLLFGKHQPDPALQRWENGLFITACLTCHRAMIKPVNGIWQLRGKEVHP
jgi:hypothetical protein